MPKFDVDTRRLLQSLEQPLTTPRVTSMSVRPLKLFPLFGRVFVCRIPIEESILVIQYAEGDGFEQAQASDGSDEESTCGGDSLVGYPSDGEERGEVVKETKTAFPTGRSR